MTLKAPFPYFGGKSTIADIVWRALGNPKHYIEPFFGSGAVLLARRGHRVNDIETVCDADGFICNVWRSLQLSPDETAKWCDWPVNHIDLMSRKAEILRNKNRLLDNMIKDPKWHDPTIAGYWIWAASCWIGSGLTCPGQRPNIGDSGKGVHKMTQKPHISTGGNGVTDAYNDNIYAWFRSLSERLRYVRVVCGDWSKVCSGDWQDSTGCCGIFFDPPYGVENRGDVYDVDSKSVAGEVRRWCIARGARSTYRIVLAGYDEHEELKQFGWRVSRWKAQGGYGNMARSLESRGRNNSKLERLWFSPSCVDIQEELFM